MSARLSAIRTDLVAAVVFAVAALLTPSVGSAQPTSFRVNVGCPPINDPSIGQLSEEELNRLCFDQETANTDQPMNCGQVRTMALAARINVGNVEAQAASTQASQCDNANLPNAEYPPSVPSAPVAIPVGVYYFVRGYTTNYPEPKRSICQPRYEGIAQISGDGSITFTSGGHTWQGIVGTDRQIRLTRDGVTNPRPKNDTGIYGPVENATLFNGYCGYGYFQLGQKVG
jgi:hypothetical protein